MKLSPWCHSLLQPGYHLSLSLSPPLSDGFDYHGGVAFIASKKVGQLMCIGIMECKDTNMLLSYLETKNKEEYEMILLAL